MAQTNALSAVFDPEWATVRLVVDGSLWTALGISSMTISREVQGQEPTPVRGANGFKTGDGYFVGSDQEAPLDASVTYVARTYASGGAPLDFSVVNSVSTAGARDGAWVKVAGHPELTVFTVARSVGAVSSTTQGGVYNVAGGAGIAVGAADGVDAETFQLRIGTTTAEQDSSLRKTLSASRVLLLQSCVSQPFDSGWYFVSQVERELRDPGAILPGRDYTLSLTVTGSPSGAGQGLPGWSYGQLLEEHLDYESLLSAFPSYFAMAQGA